MTERPQFEHDNPERESMNNFHGHMPGGIYRPGSSLTGSLWEEFGGVLNQEESSWPEEDKKLLLSMRTKKNIQRDIDEYLEQNPKRLEVWDNLRDVFSSGGSHEMREQLLRPLYILLREKYSEDDLSS